MAASTIMLTVSQSAKDMKFCVILLLILKLMVISNDDMISEMETASITPIPPYNFPKINPSSKFSALNKICEYTFQRKLPKPRLTKYAGVEKILKLHPIVRNKTK